MVKWNCACSFSFSVPSGVRQGGVLSPLLFAIYVDDLILALRKLNVGCHIIDLFLSCIVYAGDMCLIAPSRSALQLLLDTCEHYGLIWCLSYNPSESRIMHFGEDISRPTFTMYGNVLDHTKEYEYLGVVIVAGNTFSVSQLTPLIRLRSAANTILHAQRLSSGNNLRFKY